MPAGTPAGRIVAGLLTVALAAGCGSSAPAPAASTPAGSTPAGSTPAGSTPAGSTPAGSTAGPAPPGLTPPGPTPPPTLADTPVTVPDGLRQAPFDRPRRLRVPAGWTVSVSARVAGARFLAYLPTGGLLVSRPGAGSVQLLPAGTGRATTFLSGLRRPHDIVVANLTGTTWVYVAESSRVVRYRWAPGDTRARSGQVVVDGLPDGSTRELNGGYAHALKNIAVGGGRLFVSIASTCNVCDSDTTSDPVRGAVYSYTPDGRDRRLVARGIRNAEGLAFVPGSTELWAVVNNRDNLAYPVHGDVTGDGRDDYATVVPAYVDDHPPEEFLHVRDGADFGWPYCNPDPNGPGRMRDMPVLRDAQTNPDGRQRDCATVTRVQQGIQAHSAPLGLSFLLGTRVPGTLRQGAVAALHGSWNRTRRTGYKVVWFPWEGAGQRPGDPGDLVTGWLDDDARQSWGRPVDVVPAPDGGLTVSDDQSGTVYRLVPPR